MAKKIHESEPVTRSSDESDSDSSSSSSDGEALKQTPPQATAGKAVSSGSDSDDFERPLKTIRSKATENGSKLNKPISKPSPSATPMKTPTKRPATAGKEKDGKKSKTGGEEEEKKSVLFQRLWSEDDEIAILEGMIAFKEKKGKEPLADSVVFYSFVKDSVRANVDRKQLVDKVRRLKNRYKTSLKKKNKVYSNPNERKIIELSRKIWGQKTESEDLDEEVKTKSGIKSLSKNAGTTYNWEKEEEEEENSGEEEKVESSEQFLGKASVMMGLSEAVVKAGLKLCSEEEKAELEEKWRKLHLEESALFMRKLELAGEESRMIIEALRSMQK